jgi:hypothetical protein
MAHGDPQLSPWVNEFQDYLGRRIVITVNFNNATRALQTTVVHRDTGCLFHTIVFDDPGDNAKAKRLAAPNDGQGDRTYTANQMAGQGLNTIEDAMGVQITCER